MKVIFYKKIYENSENGYCIFKYSTRDKTGISDEKFSFYDKENIITATGYYLPTATNMEYEFEGEWKKTEKYGPQFVVTSFEPVVPDTTEGIVAYLSSGLVKGIGKKTAQLIVDIFGKDTINVLDETPEMLLTIKGISRKKLDKIVESYKSSRVVKDIVSFLAPYNISVNKIMKIYKVYGSNSMKIVKKDPFELCKIDGFGFKTVDAIARHLNISPNDNKRIAAAAKYVLDDAQVSGHLFLEYVKFFGALLKILNEGYSQTVVVPDEAKNVVDEMIANSLLIKEGELIYTKACFSAEHYTAENIARLLKGGSSSFDVSEDDIREAEEHFGFALSERQKEAVITCLRNDISIVTGGPGTGKTTTLKVVLYLYQKHIGNDIQLMAPTGRAARRMEESTGFPASTIHSALKIFGSDNLFENEDSIESSFVVIDEFSMVDMFLADKLFDSINSGTKILLVGDPDQLPSIGPGNVFREFICCGAIPVTVLNVIYRQAETSTIVSNAIKINSGNRYIEYNDEFDFRLADSDIDAQALAISEYLDAVRNYGIENVQILSPFRTKSEAGVNCLNEKLQHIINPPSNQKHEISLLKRIFREGDRVMQTQNSGDISNGDVGTIVQIKADEDNPEIHIVFSGGRYVVYEREDWDILDLAYATTVHKSQGSEYKVVILTMLNSFYVMLKRNLLYTAVTRAKERVVIVGHQKAVNDAILRNDIDKRNTKLAKRIIAFAT